MAEATEATVLGRFDGAEFAHAGVTSQFSRRNGSFVVRTDGADGQLAEFGIKYTFGVYPLQQYLVPFPDGRLQALGIAWDARPREAGGQRWFHLYPEHTPRAGDPLHWTGIDQNWNYQCADCHSTNLRKNYDATGRFATTWSEISVGCEACHGPASNHVVWAGKNRDTQHYASKGLALLLDERQGVSWAIGPSGNPVRSAPRTSSREIESCARCHARRSQFSDEFAAGQPWPDALRPALLESPLYYPDGQQREEVYTWGSFLQSRMHAQGVTCADCHDPHTQKLRVAGNAVCAQCHAPATFDVPAHHQHEPGSTGAACAACHMPATTYMVVDPRHDHSFRIPRPDRTLSLGTPNACNQCHADRDANWAAEVVAQWYPERKTGFQTFAEAFHLGDRGAPGAQRALMTVATDPAQPAIVRASAVFRLARFVSPATLPALVAALNDADALVRTAAVDALSDADAGTRLEHLPRLLRDPARIVRMDAARALAGEAETRLLADERGAFDAALKEWVQAQQFNAERPEAWGNLGSLALAQGNGGEAITAFRKALTLDPTFVQAAVNLADAHPATNAEDEAEKVLRESLMRNPDAGVLHHVLGLSLIRQQRTEEALKELAAGAELAREDPRFAYVYAVALHDTGDARAAVATLESALEQHPYDRDILLALAGYQREAGNVARAGEIVRLLKELEPDNAEIASLSSDLSAQQQ
jgi:Flp pilus assembly protein TadD